MQQKITDNIVTDVNGNVDAGIELARPQISPEAAILFDKSVIAKPLMVPEVCSIRVKNTEYRYRWVNHGSCNGQWYRQRRSAGFINATTDDVEVLGGDTVATESEIRAGDVTLMKIQAHRYDAAMKFNMQKAITLQRSRGMTVDAPSMDVFDDRSAKASTIAQESYTKTGLASNFIPDNPNIYTAQAQAGKAAAERVVDEIRENIQAGKKARE